MHDCLHVPACFPSGQETCSFSQQLKRIDARLLLLLGEIKVLVSMLYAFTACDYLKCISRQKENIHACLQCLWRMHKFLENVSLIQVFLMLQAIKEGAFSLHMTPDELAKVDGNFIFHKQSSHSPTQPTKMQLKLTFIRILFSLFLYFLSLGKNKTGTERHFSLILNEKAFVLAKSFIYCIYLIAFHARCIRVARTS